MKKKNRLVTFEYCDEFAKNAMTIYGDSIIEYCKKLQEEEANVSKNLESPIIFVLDKIILRIQQSPFRLKT